MPQLQLIVVAALCVYRITRFLIKDTLIEKQRDWVHSKLLLPPKPWKDKVYELIDCPFCLSVWITGITVAVIDSFISVPLPVLAWLAICGAAMIVWRYIELPEPKEETE